MRLIQILAAATLLVGLVAPAFAQADPHHPDEAETPAGEASTTKVPAESDSATATAGCPDPMGGMMGMMDMMQPGQNGAPQMQMMGMMQMMQMMQMQQMQMQQMQMQQMQMMEQMQQMQQAMPAPEAPVEEGSP